MKIDLNVEVCDHCHDIGKKTGRFDPIRKIKVQNCCLCSHPMCRDCVERSYQDCTCKEIQEAKMTICRTCLFEKLTDPVIRERISDCFLYAQQVMKQTFRTKLQLEVIQKYLSGQPGSDA